METWRIKYLPLSIVVLLIATVSTTLYLTYNKGHVSDSAPYISDTGTLPPESCIFGQALNILWVLISFAMYIKYRQVSYLLNKNNMEQHQTLNRSTFYIGLLAAFGSSIVANFQETNVLLVHWIGAILVFGGGSVYQCTQTVLYKHLVPVLGQKVLLNLRYLLSVLSTASFLVFFTCAMISYYQKEVKDNFLHWKPEDGGYKYHNISVFSEWICASSTIMYLSLFSEDFKKIIIRPPIIFTEDSNCTEREIIHSVQGGTGDK